jgi:colanic acid biosynthesis glycosyl transferase WcaI
MRERSLDTCEWQVPNGLPNRWLVITQYYLPEQGATQVRLSTLIRILTELGIDIEVLTGMPNYPTGTVAEEYKGRWTYREVIDGVKVHRTWVYGYGGNNPLRRVANFVSFTVSASLRLFSLNRPELVFVESLPLPVGLLGILCKVFWRIPYIYNIPDMQIEVARDMGWTKNRLLLRLAEGFENILIGNSWRTSTVTEGFIEFYNRERQIPREKLTFLPNGADTRFLKPMDADLEMARRWGLIGKKVFVYAGTHANYHRLETIVEAAEQIKYRNDIRIVMVGQGPTRQHIMELARGKDLANVIFGDSPFEETPRLMSISTAALVVLRDASVSSRMRLAKTFPPMACGKPVIFSGDGESASLIREHECGLVTAPENPRALADAIVRLADDEELACTMGQNGLRFVQQELDWTKIAKRWLADLMTPLPKPFR